LKSAREWKQEYYPVPVYKLPKKMTKLQMVEHSLRKWRGLRPEVLEQYDVQLAVHTERMHRVVLGTGVKVEINARSCVLCDRFCRSHADPCNRCPLQQTLDNRCDGMGSMFKVRPFQSWQVCSGTPDPEPMIRALERTRARLIEEQQKRKQEKEARLRNGRVVDASKVLYTEGNNQEVRFERKVTGPGKTKYVFRIIRGEWTKGVQVYQFRAWAYRGRASLERKMFWFPPPQGEAPTGRFPDTDEGRQQAEKLAEKFIWVCTSQMYHDPKRNTAFANPTQFHEHASTL
jgi:hypothetical protein